MKSPFLLALLVCFGGNLSEADAQANCPAGTAAANSSIQQLNVELEAIHRLEIELARRLADHETRIRQLEQDRKSAFLAGTADNAASDGQRFAHVEALLTSLEARLLQVAQTSEQMRQQISSDSSTRKASDLPSKVLEGRRIDREALLQRTERSQQNDTRTPSLRGSTDERTEIYVRAYRASWNRYLRGQSVQTDSSSPPRLNASNDSADPLNAERASSRLAKVFYRDANAERRALVKQAARREAD